MLRAASAAASIRPDAYVSVRWDDSKLLANSLYGHRVTIDPNSGKITAQEFTK